MFIFIFTTLTTNFLQYGWSKLLEWRMIAVYLKGVLSTWILCGRHVLLAEAIPAFYTLPLHYRPRLVQAPGSPGSIYGTFSEMSLCQDLIHKHPPCILYEGVEGQCWSLWALPLCLNSKIVLLPLRNTERKVPFHVGEYFPFSMQGGCSWLRFKATRGGPLRCFDPVTVTINYYGNCSYLSTKTIYCLKP